MVTPFTFYVSHQCTFHALFLIAWLADGDSLMCFIVTMGRQIAKMFYTFSLWGSLFLIIGNILCKTEALRIQRVASPLFMQSVHPEFSRHIFSGHAVSMINAHHCRSIPDPPSFSSGQISPCTYQQLSKRPIIIACIDICTNKSSALAGQLSFF